MAGMAVNQNVATYATKQIYVTPAEFKAAGTGVDVSQLIPGDNNQAHQMQALVMHLQRASAYADGFCQKVLAATVDTQYKADARVLVDPWLGPLVKIPLDYTPIVAVSAVSAGWTPSGMTTLTDLSNVSIRKKTVHIPIMPGTGTAMQGPPMYAGSGGSAHVSVQYVNGWANTTIGAPANAGATSVTVASTLGIMPGQALTLWNTNNAEQVTVSPAWVPSNTGVNVAVPLAAPLIGTYAAGDTASAMPQEIKIAVILIAKSLIKTRGSESITLPAVTSQPDHINREEPGVSSDMGLAEDILSRYRRTF